MIAVIFAGVLGLFVAGNAADRLSGGDGFIKNPSSVEKEYRHPAFR